MRRAIASSVLALSAASLLAGCPDRGISKVDPAQGRVEFKDIPVKINRDVDILFVIDDSPSMADKQKNLADNFPNFITELQKIEGGLPNVHIGVVTSDMGSKGAEDATPATGIGTIGMGGCSGLGKNGNLRVGTGSPVMNGEPFISDVLDAGTGMRVKNYSGDLAAAFTIAAKAGDGGCGFEQHLEAMKQALVPTNTANAGFLRADAYLAVVLIADEDDCSMSHASLLQAGDNGPLGAQQSFRCTRFGVLCDDNGDTTATMNQVGAKGRCHPNDQSAYLTKVSGYVEFLKGLKTDPSKVIVAGIIGTADPFAVELRAPQGNPNGKKLPSLAHSCSYTDTAGKMEVADPPVRMKFFLDQFPNRSTFSTICQSDLSGGLAQIGDLLKSVIGDPCIQGKLADVDTKTPGDQFDCAVATVQNPGKDNEVQTILPKCTPEDATATNQPCWHLADDPTNCSTTPDKKTLKVEGQDTLPDDTHVIANCVTEVTDETP